METYSNIILYQTSSDLVSDTASTEGEPCVLLYVSFKGANLVGPGNNEDLDYGTATELIKILHTDSIYTLSKKCSDETGLASECLGDWNLWKWQGDCRRDLRYRVFAKYNDGK